MKHDTLRSIAHNIADSFASGIGLLIGRCMPNVFLEAAKSPEGFITIDFLNGTVAEGQASAELTEAAALYREALVDLCTRQGASISLFDELTVRYSKDALDHYALVVIKDGNGRRSADEYMGTPLRHHKIVDDLGRLRTKRH